MPSKFITSEATCIASHVSHGYSVENKIRKDKKAYTNLIFLRKINGLFIETTIPAIESGWLLNYMIILFKLIIQIRRISFITS